MGFLGKPTSSIPCVLCRREYSDIVCHLIADCPALYQERNILWDYIIDSVDIYCGMSLSNMNDEQFVDILCGQKWTGFRFSNNVNLKKFYSGLSDIIVKHFWVKICMNYEWLH